MSIERINTSTCSHRHSFHKMIHVRIDRHHPTSVDIYVNISDQSPSTPMLAPSNNPSSPDEHIYDRLFDQRSYTSSRQSSIVKSRTDSASSWNRKHYTLQQVLENVETIQEQYERVVQHRKSSSTTLTCLSTFKQLAKVLKNMRSIKSSDDDQPKKMTCVENKSPFIFGGETLQWIALPRDDHIYENEVLS